MARSDRICQALHDVGIRGALCYETSDRDGRKARDEGLAENARFASGRAGDDPCHARAMIGAHAPFTLEDDTLDALADLVARTSARPFTSTSRRTGPIWPTPRAERCPSASAWRGWGRYDRGRSWPTASTSTRADRGELARAGAWFATNARSNMTNAVGLAPARGSNVAPAGPTESGPT